MRRRTIIAVTTAAVIAVAGGLTAAALPAGAAVDPAAVDAAVWVDGGYLSYRQGPRHHVRRGRQRRDRQR
jgi:hypothetical protein